jgi:hypothetical protein
MSRALRRTSLVLLWLMLALLPLRGWANLAMHLPAPAAPGVAPCHGDAAQAKADDTAVKTCTLCELCHGSLLPLDGVAPLAEDRCAQTLPLALFRAAPQAEPDGLFRPPRR